MFLCLTDSDAEDKSFMQEPDLFFVIPTYRLREVGETVESRSVTSRRIARGCRKSAWRTRRYDENRASRPSYNGDQMIIDRESTSRRFFELLIKPLRHIYANYSILRHCWLIPATQNRICLRAGMMIAKTFERLTSPPDRTIRRGSQFNEFSMAGRHPCFLQGLPAQPARE